MSERKMYNFPFVEDGQTYWRSRSCTVVGFVFCFDKDGFVCVLANQRGPGAPTEVGKWNVPCGYIDFNEDGFQGVSRETFEETGVKINPKQFHFDSVSFSEHNEQNINLRYWATLDGTIDDYPLSNVANEENETSDIRWIRVMDVEKYTWAFGHSTLVPEMCHKHVDFQLHHGQTEQTLYVVTLKCISEPTNAIVGGEKTILLYVILLRSVKNILSSILTICGIKSSLRI